MKCLENRILNEKKQKEKLLTCRSRAYYVSAGQKDIHRERKTDRVPKKERESAKERQREYQRKT